MNSIKRFLEILDHSGSGGVTEICLFQGGDVPTHVGYFSDLDAAANAIQAADGKGNIFVSLNPIKRDLLARANNRLIEGTYKQKLKRTQNGETACESWLFLDIDANRPSGISSTEAELQAAIECGTAVRDWLILIGVPESAILTARSGNGAYVLVRLPDYEVTQEHAALKAALLRHIANLFDIPSVKIDQSVKNDARLMCALGSMKVKGENIPERPHRRSAISTVGGQKFAPSIAQRCLPFDLFTLAKQILPEEETAPKPTPRTTSSVGNGQRQFDIRHYLNRLEIGKEDRGYQYATCPACHGVNKLYINKDNGAYGCFHMRAGTCSHDAIREALGHPRGLPRQPPRAFDSNPEGKSESNHHQQAAPLGPLPWDLPIAFHKHELPEFPVAVLPRWLRAFCEEEARATQTPPDLSAMIVLACCASAIAGKVSIQARAGWIEPTNIYTLVALPPGNRKTAVVGDAKRPLEDFEHEILMERLPDIEAARIERDTLEERLSHLKKSAGKEDDSEKRQQRLDEAKSVAEELRSLVVPAPPKLIVSGDITPEAIGSNLAEQGGRLFVCSDEGELFEMLGGRYSNGSPNCEIVLKAHTGSKVRIDRRGRSEIIDRATLTIALAPQPAVLQGIAAGGGRVFRGKGLLARWLYSIPPSTVGRRKSNPDPVSTETSTEYAQKLRDLARLSAVKNEEGVYEPMIIAISAEAHNDLTSFMEEIEPTMGEDGEFHGLADWMSKLAGATVRIAGILHLADYAGNRHQLGEIPSRTMKRAISIGRYLIPHAQAAYTEMGSDPEVELAKRILRWVEKNAVEENGAHYFRKQSLWQGVKGGAIKKASDLDKGLAILEEHLYLRPVIRDEKRGSKTKVFFEINPEFFNTSTPPNSPNSPNSTLSTVEPLIADDLWAEESNQLGELGELGEPENLNIQAPEQAEEVMQWTF